MQKIHVLIDTFFRYDINFYINFLVDILFDFIFLTALFSEEKLRIIEKLHSQSKSMKINELLNFIFSDYDLLDKFFM